MFFVEKLLLEIARAGQLQLQLINASGGSTCPFRMINVRSSTSPQATHYVQIVNCTSDGNVKPYIQERYESLARADFQLILGLRDVHPVDFSAIASLRQNLTYQVRTVPIQVSFILGVMEIEAWFIGEHSHFTRLDARLDASVVESALGVDPASADLQQIPNPASVLHQVYRVAGLTYTKSMSDCLRTLNSLDYARIYCDLINRFPDLNNFIQSINRFLALPPTA